MSCHGSQLLLPFSLRCLSLSFCAAAAFAFCPSLRSSHPLLFFFRVQACCIPLALFPHFKSSSPPFYAHLHHKFPPLFPIIQCFHSPLFDLNKKKHKLQRKGGFGSTHRTLALCSDVWQKRKRTSLRPLAKAKRPDMSAFSFFSPLRFVSLLFPSTPGGRMVPFYPVRFDSVRVQLVVLKEGTENKVGSC